MGKKGIFMEKEILQVNMFGEFSLTYGGATIDDSGSRSKKLWTLLEYLLVFRDREITQNELIELLWPDEDVSDPANTLKVLVFRIRQMLDQIGLNGKSLIVSRRGTYSWQNGNVDLIVDTNLFEELYHKAESLQDNGQKLSCLLHAIDIYKGDFLPKTAYEVWAVSISTYYHGVYIKLVKDAIAILKEQNRLDDIIRICRNAVVIDPYDETLHICLIESLADCGRYRDALSHYETVTKMFYSQFGITPSKEFMAIYKRVIKMTNDVQTDLTVIKSGLQEVEDAKGAFFCEYEIFKEIYQLEARAQSRSGQTIFLCLLTITDAKGEQPNKKMLSSAMDKLMRAISVSLRHGDVYARFSISQYLIILPCVTLENGEMVMERIIRRFRQDNPRSTAAIHYSVQPIEPKR